MQIETVLGTVDSAELGTTLLHEHVACFLPYMHTAFGDKWFRRDELIQAAAEQLKHAKERYGIRTVVDGTPLNLGRDIHMLREVSVRSGVHVIASSGLYFTEEPSLQGKSAEYLADLFIEECQHGIEQSGIRPGMLKCATDKPGFTPMNTMLLKMISLVHRATGLPIFAHSSAQLRLGLGQLDRLEECGVDPRMVIIGHCADTDDPEYVLALLRRGCYVGFDRYRHLPQRVERIAELIRQGWGPQLVLSHDYCSFLDFGRNRWEDERERQHSGGEQANGYTYIHREILPMLRAQGVSEQEIAGLFIDNPRQLLERGQDQPAM